MTRPGNWLLGLLRVLRGHDSGLRRGPHPAARLECLEGRTLLSGNEPGIVQPPPDAPGVAVSLDAVTYYSPAWVFTDAFKAAMPWSATAVDVSTGEAGRWGGGGVVSVNGAGWPTELRTWVENGRTYKQRLDTLMFRDIGGKYPAGRYTVAWEGTGRIGFGSGARVVSSDRNSMVIDVRPQQNGIWLQVHEIDPADPIRNIRVWMPDANGQTFAGRTWRLGDDFSPFHPEFLDRLRPFKAIRFMDWAETNGSQLVSWGQRRSPDDAFQGVGDKRGVAYEYMVQLVNDLDADAWLNIPHQADDEFVRNLATLFRDHLEPGRRVILEWSNEVWNTARGFTTFNWLQQQNTLPEFAGRSEFAVAAEHIKRDFGIWSEVWGQTGQSDRLTRVVAGQAGNGWVLEDLLSNMDGQFDAVAVAGYLGLNGVRDAYTARTTAEQVARDLLDVVPGTVGGLYRAREIADRYAARLGRDIQLFTYEGGQHLDGNNAPYQQAFYDAQTHPLMHEAYEDLLQGFYQIGGDLFTHFTFMSGNHPSGSWGSLGDMTQSPRESPKHRALLDATGGALFRPELRIEMLQPKALERGGLAGQVRVVRYGDKRGPLDVGLRVSGTAEAADFLGLPDSLHFEPGEASKVIDIVPADDGAAERDESVVLALAAGADYDVDDRFGSAQISIVDDDGYSHHPLRVRNAGFESGSLADWSPEGDHRFGVASKKVSNAPDGGHGEANYVWASGANGFSRGGGTKASLVQRLDLREHARRIEDGGARLTVTAWGAGGGDALDAAAVEVRFFDRAGDSGGKPLGEGVYSKRVFAAGAWTAMVVDVEVPGGARGVEVRLVGERRSGDLGMNVGFDDVSAVLHAPETGQRPPAEEEQPPPAQQPAQPPAPHVTGDVGAPAAAGQTTVVAEGSAYDLVGAAAGGVTGTADAFHFAYQQRDGDFDIRVRVAAIAGAEATAAAGLMARAALDPSSSAVFASATAGRTRFTARKAAEATAKVGKAKAAAGTAEGYWLRLRRAGATFTGYRSDDGVTWKKLGSARLKSLGPTVYFGLAAASGTPDATTQVQFRDLGEFAGPARQSRRLLARALPQRFTPGLPAFVPAAKAADVLEEAAAPKV